jgi:ABC-type enterobactin transport system permease subunit
MAKLDWKKIVGTVAPTLATALGGPLAGIAVKTIATQLLGNADASEDEVETAILSAQPQTLLQLKQIELEFKKVITDAGIKLEEISSADRNSARQREIEAKDSWTPRVLAAVVVGGFLYCVYAVFSGYITDLKDPMIATLVGTMIGYTSAKADQIVSYYFGSSASSKAKDDTISTIAKME